MVVQCSLRGVRLDAIAIWALELSGQLTHFLSLMDLSSTLVPLSLQFLNILIIKLVDLHYLKQYLVSFLGFLFHLLHECLVFAEDVIKLSVVVNSPIVLWHFQRW